MATTAADVFIDNLCEWGIDTIFGLPGDGINGLMESLRTRQDRIRFIQVRHEETAAFMACAYAKYTRRIGVCLATSGPGGIHLLNGCYDAKMDGAPVLAITGHHFHDLIDTHAQQDVDLNSIFKDVAVYNTRIMGPKHVENVVHLAIRTALTRRGVAHINFPVDTQSLPVKKGNASKRNQPYDYGPPTGSRMMEPDMAELEEAASILKEGSKVAILAGQGALHATDELIAVAEKLGAPIIKALLGKACVPDDHPLTTGGVGLLGTAPSQRAMEECDTLLIVGSSFPYLEFMPKPGQAKCVQIDLDPARIGLRYPVDVGIVGDSRKTLAGIDKLLERNVERDWLQGLQADYRKWLDLMAKRGSRMDKPMKPQVVAWELGKRLRDDAIVSSDSGTIATWFARQIPARRGQMYSLSGTLATMANGLPYAMAAQLAYPNRQCIAFVGDGGLSMLMAEFATAVKYRLPIKVVVINNGTLGQIKWEQMVFLGNPEYGNDLQPIDFAKVAEACGGKGIRCDDPEHIGTALDEALQHEGPVIVDAIVDKNEPPMPGKITMDQALRFAESMVRGEKYASSIIKTITKDKVKELI